MTHDQIIEGSQIIRSMREASNEVAQDGRQSGDVSETGSRFRPRYRALTDAEKSLLDAIKSKAAELEVLFEQVKPGRYRSLGLTALEESVMWTVKELTS